MGQPHNATRKTGRMPGPARKSQDKKSVEEVANPPSRKTISCAGRPSTERDFKNEGASGDIHENKRPQTRRQAQ
jgi:hypothetical protein